MESEERQLEIEYCHEKAIRTLLLGNILCKWGLPIVAALAIGEAFVYGDSCLFAIRLLFIIPAALFLLLSRNFFSKNEQYIIPVHLLSLSGAILMMLFLAYYRFSSPVFNTAHQLATITGGLVTMIVVCFLFSGGLRKYLVYIVTFPLLLLILVIFSKNTLTFKELSFFVNPLVAALGISIYSIFEENKSYTAFKNKKGAELKEIKLQKELDANKEQELKLKKQLEEDALTGVYNRSLAYSILEKLTSMSQPFTLCFIDLDNFKMVNDLHGHLYGDSLLVDFAKYLKNNLRKTDYICRIGGDEFLAILPNSDPLEAEIIIERIRKEIINNAINNYNLDFSYGISQYHSNSNINLNDLLNLADRKMYSNKLLKNLTNNSAMMQ